MVYHLINPRQTSIPKVSEKSHEYVRQVLGFGFHNAASLGFTGRLEKAFATKFGAKYSIHHVNGTATMHSALVSAGVGVGDEVIVLRIP